MSDNNVLVIGIVLVILITAGLTYYIAKGSGPSQVNPSNMTNPTITVDGEASKTVTPDLITISFSVDTVGATASDSEMANSRESANLKAALLSAGLNESEIQTSSYSTYPNYPAYCNCMPAYPIGTENAVPSAGSNIASPSYAPGAATSGAPMMVPPDCNSACNASGYKTTEVLTVASGDITDGGKFIQAALGASNSTSVDYVYFSLTDQARIQADADLQAQAAAAARAKAEGIAKGLGASLGRIESVNPEYNPIYPVYAYGSAGGNAAPSAPPTQIYPTSTTLTSSVTVVYDLAQ